MGFVQSGVYDGLSANMDLADGLRFDRYRIVLDFGADSLSTSVRSATEATQTYRASLVILLDYPRAASVRHPRCDTDLHRVLQVS